MLRPHPGDEDLAKPTIPQVTLKGGDIDAAKIDSNQGNGATKVGRVIAEVGHNAATVGAIQFLFAGKPVPPMVAQNLLLLLLTWTIMRIGIRHREKKNPLIIPFAPRKANVLAAEAKRSKSVGRRSS